MKQFHKWLTLWGMAAAAILTAMTLTAATYAWFSANRQVETGKVTSKTGSKQLMLQISRKNGADFPGREEISSEVELKPLAGVLLPVSTADLETFFYCPVTNAEDNAEVFLQTTDESMYYHDTIYLRVVGDGFPAETRVGLFLDNTADKPIVKAESGNLLTAARLGLKFNNAGPVILTLSDEADVGEGNTWIDGRLQGGGKVLGSESGNAVPVDTPAKPYTDFLYALNASALAELKLEEIYTVDVYFYLEGCDPDCTDHRVGADEAKLNLAFFALQTQ